MRTVKFPILDVIELILDGMLPDDMAKYIGRLSDAEIEQFIKERALPSASEVLGEGKDVDAYLNYIRDELRNWSENNFGKDPRDTYAQVLEHYMILSGITQPFLTMSVEDGVARYRLPNGEEVGVLVDAPVDEHKRAIEKLI